MNFIFMLREFYTEAFFVDKNCKGNLDLMKHLDFQIYMILDYFYFILIVNHNPYKVPIVNKLKKLLVSLDPV